MNKKKIIFLLFLSLVTLTGSAQLVSPVSWSYSAKKTSANEAEISLTATMEDAWHLYSQFVPPGGPVKTTFAFDQSPDYQLVGKTAEPKPIVQMEQVFGMEVMYFEGSVIFKQKVKLLKKKATIKGRLEYMTCNNQQCIPPTTEEFSIPIL